jgi:hypothetical protein
VARILTVEGIGSSSSSTTQIKSERTGSTHGLDAFAYYACIMHIHGRLHTYCYLHTHIWTYGLMELVASGERDHMEYGRWRRRTTPSSVGSCSFV